MKIINIVIISLLLLINYSYSFYLPGVAPKDYLDGEIVPLKVNSLTSTHTQMPYLYYSLPFCQPEEIEDMVENLGEILMGDRIENSPYRIESGIDSECKILCHKTYSKEQLKIFAERIEEDYRINLLLDNLPAATKKPMIDSSGKKITIYDVGFPLGRKGKDIEGGDENQVYINNHINMKIFYHTAEALEGRRIVGFEVEPESIQHSTVENNEVPSTCFQRASTIPQSVSVDSATISWTYSVKWEFRNIKWASRWDIYLLMTEDQIHWFSIINSLMIVLFLTGMVAMIMMRTLHADLKRYKEMETLEEAQEETGWKLVHGDVFRPPANSMLLSVLIGTGVQVLVMTLITMIFAVLGFLSPANRGGLMTAMVVLFVLMGSPAGYFSARLYNEFKGKSWKRNTILTSILFPGFVFVVFFILNFVLAFEKSSGAVPFGTLVALIALWFGVSVPLVFIGSYFGFKAEVTAPPVRTNQIPRQVPEQVWYMRPTFSILMGGILPFGAVFIELFFILSSIWLHQFYYIFGFLSIVLMILFLTCAEITIVMCYFQLCSEDYHWWWRAYLTSGSSALYMFLYSIFYFATKLQINKFASSLLYFGYTLMMAAGFFVVTGTVGFYACYYFIRKIYASVKVE
eukprot:TRINITY_DN1143_c0_g2_i1.p1 TRINITY_DN1143_c0_g2~~TRINITY_DN1143_c0_g2_i1.p1  ORF type:complete len:630 (-),score=245.86 TRINITY_DN1143_c0_g2_i1:107-1996(-)